MRRAASVAIAAVCTTVLAACVATETGNPSIDVDPTAIDAMVLPNDPMLPEPPASDVRGGAGSVDPPRGEVWIWPLESSVPPTRAPVAMDGSFQAIVPVGSGAAIRLQVRDGAAMSRPVDARIFEPGGFTPAAPASTCVRVSPEPTAPLPPADGEVRIRVSNDCDEPITRRQASLRVPSGDLSIADDGALTLAPGTSVEIVVAGTGTPPEENIVLVPIEAPAEELRAISLLP